MEEINRYLYDSQLIAIYMINGHAVSQDLCDIRVCKPYGCGHHADVQVHLGNGNHPKGFNEVDIINNDNITILQLFYDYDDFSYGAGTLDKKLRVP